MNFGDALLALMWGLISGSALLIGAGLGWYVKLSRRTVAWVMAFGSGILVSAIAFDLMDEAFKKGGLLPCSLGFLAGAMIFTGASVWLARRGAANRKRSMMPDRGAENASAIAFGTAIDGIPESIVIGLSIIEGKGVALATVIAIFLSNIPEALSSSTGMKAAGRSTTYVFRLWGAIAAMSGAFSLLGYVAFADVAPEWVAVTQALGGGALLALIADTMIPEAFANSHDATGLVASVGFIAGFALSHGLT